MIRLLAPCVLGSAVVALTLSTPAHASYRDGASLLIEGAAWIDGPSSPA
jgi:hypothetical protein